MAVVGRARAATSRVVADGQSLNLVPSVSDNYPIRLVAGRGIPLSNLGVTGFSWYQLSGGAPSTSVLNVARRDPYLNKAILTVLIMCGGTTDYALNRTGAQCYADQGTYVVSARAAATGTLKIIGTTTTPTTTFTGAQTRVAAASNGVDTATYAGAGTLTVVDTTAFGSTGTLKVRTSTGTATVTYTGKTGTTFTGCTKTAGGGTLATAGAIAANTTQASAWIDGNALVMGDASTRFDATVDLAADSRLANPADTTYYNADGTHFVAAGAQVAADLIAPTLTGYVG